jgi:hypothetical protein
VSNQSKFSAKAQRLEVQGIVTGNTEWFGSAIVTIGQAKENSAPDENSTKEGKTASSFGQSAVVPTI